MTIHEHFTTEHTQLRQRVADFQKLLAKNPASLEEAFVTFQQAIRAHFRKEDEVYYPYVDAGKKIADRELIHALRNDHAAVVFTLESLLIRLRRKVPMDEWKTKFDTMIKVLLPHFDHEEKKLYPEVELLFKPAELQTLLEKIQALK